MNSSPLFCRGQHVVQSLTLMGRIGARDSLLRDPARITKTRLLGRDLGNPRIHIQDLVEYCNLGRVVPGLIGQVLIADTVLRLEDMV